nr:hypothetical protein BaRGS_017857 [Batillaria attramentaria]
MTYTDGNSLFVSNGTDVLRFDRETKLYESLFHQHGGRIVGLAADVDDGILFWSDISEQYRAIYKSWTDGSSIQIIITDVMECNGLSVDWISNHIYWTDAGRLTVEIANYDGSGRRILIGYNLQIPRGIIVDPVFGYVFWADQGTKKIERAGLDGSERQVLVDKDLYWPNQLAVSYPTRRIYWVDAKQRTIASCDIDGGTVTIERHLSSSTTGFGLVVIGNNAIISTWFKAKILSTFVATRTALWTDELEVAGESFSAKSCEAPSELLFFTLKGSGEVVYWSDVKEHVIYKASLAGGEQEVFLNSSDGIGIVDVTADGTILWEFVDVTIASYGLIEALHCHSSSAAAADDDYDNDDDDDDDGDDDDDDGDDDDDHDDDGLALDWVGRQLYLTNMGYSEPGLDGAVYSWHRIEMIALHKGQRKTVVTDVERPRGLDLDIENGFMFYGDWGRTPKIVQAHLDGSHSRVILDEGLSNPNGLTFHNGQVYVADSNYNNRTTGPHLKVYNVEKEYWQDLKLSSNISLPMGLAVRGYTLYYSDWISVEPDAVGYIKSYDLRHQPRQFKTTLLIASASTHHAAMPVFGSQGKQKDPFQCICPDESAKILASNYATCDRPENFLLYADLNTLQLVSLDSDTEATPHVLLKRLYGSPFNDIAPHEVFSGELFMDGLAVDTDRQRLYFTGYNSSGDGVIARINLQRSHVRELSFLKGSVFHVYGLVVFDHLLFYSDWYTNGVYMVDMVTGRQEPVAQHLSRPTSLVIYHPANLTVESPWEVTESGRCNDLCDMNAYCAQLVPQLEYQCVCKAGYEGNGKKCGEPNTKMVNNMCMDIITESTTEDQTQEDDMSTVTHGYGYFTRDLGLSASPGDVSPENASQRKMDGGGVGSTTASGTEQPFYEPFPGGDRDKPYFESCENREVFLEPDANGRAIVDVATARDGYGNRLPVISTIDIDNDHISLEWAKGTQQTVVLNAYDNWRNTATCQFQVLLKDVVPPVFTSCPGDVMKKTELASDTVFWPKPVAEDNSLVVEVTGSHEPNSLFSIGVTEVNYTAEDDSGNRADCRFTVTVILEQRCSLPTFKNGAIMCRTNWEQTYSIAHARKTTPPNLSASPPELCQFTCQGNHVVNPVSLFSRPFDCRAGGEDFAKLSALMKKQDACLLKKSPTIARQEFSLSFEGPCSPDDEALKQELRVQILDPLDEKNLCEWAECHHGNITIHCGPPPPSKRRSGTVPDTFDMRWNVTIQSSEGLSRDKVDKIFLSIKLELMNMAAMPITLALQQHFQTVANSVRMFPLEFTCQPGEMSFSDGCGVTFPPIDEMSKFLIITACTFGVVFLLMVIFMYLQYQRQQRQAKQRMALMASNPHRLPTPNVYASPPIVKPADHIRRSSLDYIGCHDYEDIDGASTATKAMLQALSKSSYWHRNNSLSRSPYASNRDSLHSFKGTSG